MDKEKLNLLSKFAEDLVNNGLTIRQAINIIQVIKDW